MPYPGNDTPGRTLLGRLRSTSASSQAWLAAAILGGAVLLAGLMILFRPKAQFHAPAERIREVRVCAARQAPRRATFTGYGTAQPVREVELSAEVGGRILRLRPGLKDGTLVTADEELVQIDPADYEAARDQASAEVRWLDASLARLGIRQADDVERLALLEKDALLAESQLERIRELTARDAGSAVMLEQAEQDFLQRRNRFIDLRSQVAQHPAEMSELKARRDAAAARERVASLNVARCRIAAPFAGRVGDLAVEFAQNVPPGQPLLRLADDRELEIPVSVDAADALVLGLTAGAGDHANWFQGAERLAAEIIWTDANAPQPRPATVARIASFAPETRTVILVVRPLPASIATTEPLVAGMFCRVRIIGQEIPDAVLLPLTAIQYGNRFFLVEERRLRSLPLRILHRDESGLLVAGAELADASLVVAEKLPFGMVEGMLVDPVPMAQAAPEAGDL